MSISGVSLRLVGGDRQVRRVGFGTMASSGSYGPVEADRALAAIRAALDSGGCLIDTADVYGDGSSEEAIGSLLDPSDDVVVLTKVGLKRNPDARFGVDIDGRPSYLRTAVLKSRQRLGLDVIDVVLLHRVDEHVPVEESIGALGDLVDEGLVRGVGLSEASAGSVAVAHAERPLAVVQSEFSLWSRDVEEQGVLAACSERGITFVASSPLGKGFLTGALDWPPTGTHKDSRRKLPRFSDEAYPRNLELLGALAAVAEVHCASMAQVATAWVLAHIPASIAIPSTSNPKRVAENLGASELGLTENEVQQLSDAFALAGITGERYADMGFVNR